MRCADCEHFEPNTDAVSNLWPGSGHCCRWHQSYSDNAKDMKPNDAWVESDEGWCNMVGPEFGCVLFKPK